MTSRPFHLLVFDWDGTLLDSVSTIVECVQETLAELGQPPAEEAAVRSVIGLGVREMVASFCPGCDDRLFARVVEVYRRLWHERYASQPRLFAGILELLVALRAEGFLLAVATAKSRGGLDRDLARTGLAGLFAATRTVSESPGKPDPAMLLSILSELEVGPAEALMIGDTVHDLEMAARAGMRSIAVLSGCEERPALSRQAPVACLDSAAELGAWLAAATGGRS